MRFFISFIAVPFVMIVVFYTAIVITFRRQGKRSLYIYKYTARDKEKSMTYFQVDNCGGCVFLIVETIICLLLSSIRSDQFCAVQFCSLFFLIGKKTRPQVADANVVGSCRW